MANSQAAGLSKDCWLELTRCCFTQKMSSCLDAFPLGVVIGKETLKELHKHIVDVHFKSIFLLSQFNADTRIAPGLHFHLTPAGAERIAVGECVDSDMLTILFGRDHTLDGKTPFCVLPAISRTQKGVSLSPTCLFCLLHHTHFRPVQAM